MDPRKPSRDASYVHHQPVMCELDEAEAARRVINGQSLLCEGIAGVGKTYYVQGLVQELRARAHRGHHQQDVHGQPRKRTRGFIVNGGIARPLVLTPEVD